MAETNNKPTDKPTEGEAVRERLKTSDLIPRLLCVLIAVVIWLYVMSNESPDYERTFSGVTVAIENTALLSSEYDLSVISGYGERADITVTGKKSDLISYSLEDIIPSVDVSGITEPGKHQLSISVTTPDGCATNSVSPTSIEIYVDRIATKTVPVKVNIVSVQHDQSITLGVTTPDVSAVTVSGPATVIDAAEAAVVDLELGELTTGVTARGALRVVTEEGATIDNPYLTLSQNSVGVNVPVYIEKEIPITVGTKYGYFNESNAVISVTPKKLTVRADPALLAGVESFEIATIDEKQINSNETQIVSINLPDGVENLSGVSSASISVTHKNTVKKSNVVDDVSIRNPNNLKYTLLTDSVNVVLRAPTDIADKLTSADVRLAAELNYSGITGVVQVPVTVTVSSEYTGTVYELGEYAVSVMIEK